MVKLLTKAMIALSGTSVLLFTILFSTNSKSIVLSIPLTVLLLSLPYFLRHLETSKKTPLKRLKELDKICSILSLSLPSLSVSSYVVKNLPFPEKLIGLALSSITVFLQLSTIGLIFTKANKMKKKILLLSVLSMLISLTLHFIMKDNAVFFFTVLGIIILSTLSLSIALKFNLQKVELTLATFSAFCISLSLFMVSFNIFTALFTVVMITSTVITALTTLAVNINNPKLYSALGLGWIGIIVSATVLFWNRLPAEVIQANVLSAFLIPSVLLISLYAKKTFITPSLLTEDIDNFLKHFPKTSLFPKGMEGYRDIISRSFNNATRYVKISVLPQNSLPYPVLSKMLHRKSLSICDAAKFDRETLNFFVTNRIAYISRISNEVIETDYLLIKLPRIIQDYQPNKYVEEVVKRSIPLFQELERSISSALVLPLRQELERKRELHTREIESFERVRYFLIKDSEMFLYRNKVIAYRYIEDFEKHRGYYFDVAIETDRFVGFLMFIPDRLFLSNFALLAMKGIIKSLPIHEINHSKLEETVKEFLKDRDLPLQVSITSFEIIKDKIIIRPSEHTKAYSFDGKTVKPVPKIEEISYEESVIISNTDLPENLISEIDRTESKLNSISKFFEKITAPDSFVAICI